MFAKDTTVSIVRTPREYAIGRIVSKPLDKLGRRVYLVVSKPIQHSCLFSCSTEDTIDPDIASFCNSLSVIRLKSK